MRLCIITPGPVNPIKGGVYRVCSSLRMGMEALDSYVINCHFGCSKGDESDYAQCLSYEILGGGYDDKVECFLEIINKHKVDVLWNHSHFWEHHELCHRIKLLSGCKLVSVVHTDPLSPIKSIVDSVDYFRVNKMWVNWVWAKVRRCIGACLRYRRLQYVMRRKYLDSDAIVLLSEGYKKSMMKLLSIESDSKIHIIQNPLPFMANTAKEARKNRVLFVGRLVWQKRLDRVLRAWQKVEACIDDWELLVVGDGETRQLYESLAKSYHLKNVIFRGECEANELYQTSKMICLSSSFEGLPMVLIEAQGNGCVPVAFNSFEAVEDIINDGFTGFLVKPYDIKNYAKRLGELMNDVCRWNDMSELCQISARRYDLKLICNQWFHLFAKL